ncbi:oxaloacetate decarboxylase subunit gamma [Veronia pacifica]|uniref:Probable oxaloacetate decarboxylase gamma chain n=1 Tax=Veronia pacifica TaxID=1080227 RepID=A0A1C3EB83_9GAMM|nr:oxaloacetate decarboxylase subunit gamma [Veronia pacifica]ODA30511.1 oxaloacetate decarboxylase subunit gamma [Veronia pacifica]
MELESLLQEALTLMLTGMSVVFVFLTILIFLVGLMSRLVPEELPSKVTPSQPASPGQSNAVNPETIAAISAAVHQYRNQRRNDK